MRKKWTNLILWLGAFLYKRKKVLLTSHAVASIFNLLIIISGELLLIFLSLPLYLVSKETLSGNQRAYKIRRVISLSSFIVILVVWTFKLIFIVGLPMFFDTEQSFFISDGQKVESLELQNSFLFDIYKLKTNDVLLTPRIEDIFITIDGGLQLRGTSSPDSNVILNISGFDYEDDMDIFYLAKANDFGEWLLKTNNNKWKKVPGLYFAQVMAYDEQIGSSNFSPVMAFEINQSFQDMVISRIDIFLNYFVIIFLILGILSIILLI